MRFGVIGDVHAEAALLERAITALEAMGVDQVLCTGDIPDGLGSVDRCCELLLDHRVLTVRGNHDRWLLGGEMRQLDGATALESLAPKTIDYLKSLPAEHTIETAHGAALLCHGLGKHDMASVGLDDFGYALESNAELRDLVAGPHRYVINGHTHRAGVRSFGKLTVINAGTLARDENPCCLRVDLGAATAHRFDLTSTGEVRLGAEWHWA